MRKFQIIAISLSAILVVLIYFFGNFTDKKKNTVPPADQHSGNATEHQDEPAFNFEEYQNSILNKLSATEKTTAASLSENATKENTAIAYKDVAEFWERKKELSLAANFYKKAAFLENTEKSVTFAGNLYMAVLQRTEQPSMRKWQALEAIDCFSKALAINPNNTDTKIALATCYTEGTGETMKGVTLLREVTQTDSTNIPANIILGKLAIQSGQFDKAIKRLELVLSIKPAHTEAMYFLAEAYKGSGDNKKAIFLFEKCKLLVNNPDFTKEIDTYIKTFK